MPFWLTLGLFAFSFIATALLAPKPQFEDAKAGTLGDIRFPRSTEGSPIVLSWGRNRLRSPNVTWYGALRTEEITEKVKTSIFSSTRVVVGHKYYVTFDLSLCLGGDFDARLLRIWSGDDILWEGDEGIGETDGVTLSILKPDLYGGKKNGGGFVGSAVYYNGSFLQTPNAFIASKLDVPEILPAYRGQVHISFIDCLIGETPNLRAMSFEVEIIPNNLGLGAVGSEGDANPAEVLYDILVNDWGRLGFATGAINGGSFTAAGATLAAEGNGISLKIENANDTRDATQEILKQIDGLIYEDPITREIHLVLVRDDYDVLTLPVFDQTNVREIGDYRVTEWPDTYNQIRIVYPDRANNYVDKTAFAQDMANIEFQGGKVRSMNFSYVGVKTADLANALVARELNLNSLPLISLRINCNRDAASLRPAGVFILNWPEYGIENLVLRVQKFDLGTLDDNRVVIDCIQDRFAISNTIFAAPPATEWQRPDTLAKPAFPRLQVELPRFLGEQIIDNSETVRPAATAERSFIGYLEVPANELHTSFDGQYSDDGGGTFGTDLLSGAFAITAELDSDVSLETDEYISGASPFVLKNVSDTSGLVAATAAELAAGANIILVGDELIQFEGFTDNLDGTYTLATVWRGVLDSSPRGHAEDDLVYFISARGLDAFGSNDFAGDEVLDLKVVTNTGFNRADPDTTPDDSLTLQKRPQRPYPPDGLTLDGAAFPTSFDTSEYPITLEWLRRDRLDGAIVQPDSADQTPEVGTSYRMKYTVDGSGETIVELGTGTTADVEFGSSSGQIDMELHAVLGGMETLYPALRSFALTSLSPSLVNYDKDLYGASGLGAAYRFNQFQSYTDTGLTTNVTTTGDAISGVQDLNDNGGLIPATQNLIAEKPAWDSTGAPDFGFAEFDSNDAMETGVGDLVPEAQEGSFAARVRLDLGASGQKTIMGSFATTGTQRAWIACEDGVPAMALGQTDSSAFTGGGDIRSATDFHTIVGTWINGELRLYLDGYEVGRDTYTGEAAQISAYVGAYNSNDSGPSDHWDGPIGAAMMIDRPLNFTEVNALGCFWSPSCSYNSQFAPSGADPTQPENNSTHGIATTLNGGAELSDRQAVHGFSSLYIDGASGSYGSVANKAPIFDLGDNDFDAGVWVYFDTDSSALSHIYGRWNETGDQRSWALIRRGATDKLEFLISGDGIAETKALDATIAFDLNRWYYIRTSFDGTTWRLYADGVLIDSNVLSLTVFDTSEPLTIGNSASGLNPHDGYLGELTILNGEAVQTGASGQIVGAPADPIHFFTGDLPSTATASNHSTKGTVMTNGSGSDLEISGVRMKMNGNIQGLGEVVIATTTGSPATIDTVLGRFPYDADSAPAETDYLLNVISDIEEPVIIPAGSDFAVLATRQDASALASNGVHEANDFADWEAKLPAGVTVVEGYRKVDTSIQSGDTNAAATTDPWCVDFKGGLVP